MAKKTDKKLVRLAAKKALLQKAIGDILAGKELKVLAHPEHKERYYNYNHVLPKALQKQGFGLRIMHQTGEPVDIDMPSHYVESQLYYMRNPIGKISADVKDNVISPIIAEVNQSYRGKGLGTHLYEALFAHAKHYCGVTHVGGSKHSTLASKVHAKIARVHGLNYKPVANIGGQTFPTAADWHDMESGEFDEKWNSYKYTIKSEDALEKGGKLAKPLAVDHYSPVQGLTVLDPKHQGSAAAGQEKQRPDRPPRLYFYWADTKPESVVTTNAKVKYRGVLPPGTKLYDMAEDKHDLLQPKWVETDHGMMYDVPDLDEVERDLISRGYHGYHSYNPSIPNALALFHSLKVQAHSIPQAKKLKKAEGHPTAADIQKWIAWADRFADSSGPINGEYAPWHDWDAYPKHVEEVVYPMLSSPHMTPDQQEWFMREMDNVIPSDFQRRAWTKLLNNPSLDAKAFTSAISGVKNPDYDPGAYNIPGKGRWLKRPASIDRDMMQDTVWPNLPKRVFDSLMGEHGSDMHRIMDRVGENGVQSLLENPEIAPHLVKLAEEAPPRSEPESMKGLGWLPYPITFELDALNSKYANPDTLVKIWQKYEPHLPPSRKLEAAHSLISNMRGTVPPEFMRRLMDIAENDQENLRRMPAHVAETLLAQPNAPTDVVERIARDKYFQRNPEGWMLHPNMPYDKVARMTVWDGGDLDQKHNQMVTLMRRKDVPAADMHRIWNYLKTSYLGTMREFFRSPSLQHEHRMAILDHAGSITNSYKRRELAESLIHDTPPSVMTPEVGKRAWDLAMGSADPDSDAGEIAHYLIRDDSMQHPEIVDHIKQNVAPGVVSAILQRTDHATPEDISRWLEHPNRAIQAETARYATNISDEAIHKLIDREIDHPIGEHGSDNDLVDNLLLNHNLEFKPDHYQKIMDYNKASVVNSGAFWRRRAVSRRDFPISYLERYANDSDAGVRRRIASHDSAPVSLLRRMRDDLDPEVVDKVKKRLMEYDPDAGAEHTVQFAFNTGRARKLRDMIIERHVAANPHNLQPPTDPRNLPPSEFKTSAQWEAAWSKFIDENKAFEEAKKDYYTSPVGKEVSPKQLPAWPQTHELGRLPNGNISAEKLQGWIDNQPKMRFNVTHSTWTGAQRHNSEPSNVFQLNMTGEHMEQLQQAGVWPTFQKVMRFTSTAHPVNKWTVGWVRYTGSPQEGGVHIDEVQSDLGQGMVRQQQGLLVNQWVQRNRGHYDNGRKEVKKLFEAHPPEHWELNRVSDTGRRDHYKLKKEHMTGEDEKLAELDRMLGISNNTTIEPEAFQTAQMDDYDYEDWLEQKGANDSVVKDQQARIAKEFPEEHMNKISEILFGKQHSNVVLHEAFQQWMRDQGWHGTAVAIHSIHSKGPISSIDMRRVKRVKGEKKDKKTGQMVPTVNYQSAIPGHFRVTYDQHPQTMGFEPSTYGKLPTQNSASRKTTTIYSVDSKTGSLSSDTVPTPTWQDKVRKSEQEWEEYLADCVDIVLE